VNDYYSFFSICCSTYVGQSYGLVAIVDECHLRWKFGDFALGNQKEDYIMYMKYGLPPWLRLGDFLRFKTHVVVCRGSHNALPNRRRVWMRILRDPVQTGTWNITYIWRQSDNKWQCYNPNYGSVVNDYYSFFSICGSTSVGQSYGLVAIMYESHLS
jgi:hypothetical protein